MEIAIAIASQEGPNTDTDSNGDISRSRMTLVFLDLRDVRVPNRSWRISFPIANHEVVFPGLGDVAFCFRTILELDSGFRLGADTELGNLDLDLFGSADLLCRVSAGLVTEASSTAGAGESACCAVTGCVTVTRTSKQESKQHRFIFCMMGFLKS